MAKSKNKQQQKSLVKKSFLLSGYFLVIVVCFAIPLVHIKTTLDPVLYPRFLALGISIFVLAGLLYFEIGKTKISRVFVNNRFILVFLLFIIISIISLFFAINPIEGLTDIFKWLLIFLLILLVTYLMSNSEWLFYTLLKAIITNAILFSLIGIVQYFNDAFLNPDPNALYEVKGLMAHKNQYSNSLFLLIPFLLMGIIKLNKTWMKLAVFALILVLLIILLLQTRAVWLALIISGILTAIIIFIINSKKGFINLKSAIYNRVVFIGATLMIIFILLIVFYPVGPLKSINNRVNTVFNPKYTSNEWRIEMWDATTQLLADQSFSGVGAGNWKIAVYPYYGEYLPSVYRHWRNPHNDYLLTISEKGVLGLLAFISMFIILVYYGIQNMRRSSSIKQLFKNSFLMFGIIGYMVVSFFSFPNERINHLIFVSLMAAFIISGYYRNKNTLKNPGIRKAWVILPVLLLSYVAIHFGVIAINSELNVVKAQYAQEDKNWIAMERFADKAYSKFAPIEPKFSFPVSMYMGIPNYHRGNFDQALKYFKKSYHQHPTNISVMNNIGSVYGQMGILDSSIIYHQKSLEIFPHYEFGLINISKAYYLQKDFRNAYKEILKCDPRSVNQEVHQIRYAIENKLDN